MIGTVLMAFVLMQAPTSAPVEQPAPAPAPQRIEQAPATPAEAPPIDKKQALLKVKRIYVDSFGSGEAAQQLQAMIVTSLTDSNRFSVTENKEKADAILKGFAGEKTSQETHAYGSSTAVSTASGGHSSSISGSGHVTPYGGSSHISGSSSGGFHAAGGAIDDSSVNTETVENAKASVRLINQDGDVIWTSTQESKGAKFKGASADVADKIVKQLIRDITRAERPPASASEAK
jgi:hypothetical protein